MKNEHGTAVIRCRGRVVEKRRAVVAPVAEERSGNI